MYLNSTGADAVILQLTRLTITWDVFESKGGTKWIGAITSLTITWDVFESYRTINRRNRITV